MASQVSTCEEVKAKPSDEVSDVQSSSSSSSPIPSAPMETTKSIIDETVKGLREVAYVSYASVKEWASTHKFSQGSSNDTESAQRQAARQALSDLMSPFVACHSGMGDLYQNQRANREHSYPDFSGFPPYEDAFRILRRQDSETVFSVDTEVEDEMNQLHRLASWGTNATSDTFDTETYYGDRVAVTDDDGHVIPPALLETANKRREKRMRTRVVRFDYPPISSLRECPRHDPNDLPDLFFTEEELDEIEADRSSAIFADDIEIVAVASARSADSESFSLGQSPRHSTSADSTESKNSKKSHSFSAPILSRKPRSSSPHPKRPAKGSWADSTSSASAAPGGGDGGGVTPPSSRENSRLIKGVQIYLRERSTGKSSNRKS